MNDLLNFLMIGLTVIAMFRGWGWRSLIPGATSFGMGFVIGFCYGFFATLNGVEVNMEALRWLVVLDILACAALGYMVVRGRDKITIQH